MNFQHHPLIQIAVIMLAATFVLIFFVGPTTKRDQRATEHRRAEAELQAAKESMVLRIEKPADCEEIISLDRGKDKVKLVYRTAGNDIIVKTYTLVEKTAKMSEWLAERNEKRKSRQ